MNKSVPSQQSPGFLLLSVSMITCLILLINVSFKIVLLEGLVFSVNSLLAPLIAGIYLFTLRNCNFREQRHLLNISLMTLYLFCIGVYVLVNLPAADYMHDNPVYQIIFEDIPKKFFATTISFTLSFYLPHLLLCNKTRAFLSSPKQCTMLSVFGGLSFFCIDFYLLFSDPHAHSFKQIFIDSFMITSLLLLLIAVSYLSFFLEEKHSEQKEPILRNDIVPFPIYHYLLCFAVAVMLVCLACEYRIVSFSKDSILSASCIFFPITMVISAIIGELWGYKANLKLAFTLIAAQFAFDALLMTIVAFPSPPFFNLNPFYHYILPRRLPAASLSLFVTFLGNAMLLHYLKHLKWELQRPLRIVIANICSSSLLCLVDYSLLFGGIYPAEQIINLAANVWQYKLFMTFITLPAILWFCRILEKKDSRWYRQVHNK
ncbi:VUT family protein [Legionella shakespearei]|uniref:VUT family protein n=1 Tax=Legionella shakespearei DSM 23087 TaxID=1122169 RepID=A0A0W0YLF1_9GAMM|nr:VUT family protein [Legionella shakespearei]KTD57519.1 hypothetical protein Lsha_2360 [Legionella shakespearei DSM 23087]